MKVRCVIMRGGTSKGVFFHEDDLPRDPGLRDKVILRIMGSPDRRQIDGLGGADLLTSKVAVIGPSTSPRGQVDYSFGQVSILDPEIDWNTLCGNLSAAVGTFALQEGLVRAADPVTEVLIHTPVTGRVLKCEVPVKNGEVVSEGDFDISGVPGTGAKISLDYSDTAGGLSGKLLPSGKVIDELSVEGVGRVEVSIVDCGNLMVFIRAQDLGLQGDESPVEIDENVKIVKCLDAVRRTAAEHIGMAEALGWARMASPLAPILGIVQPPRRNKMYASGGYMEAKEMDLFASCSLLSFINKTYAGTATVCTGVAAKIDGTVVNGVLSDRGRQNDVIHIGHPSGRIPVEAAVSRQGEEFQVEKVKLWRTARRIMEGEVFVPDNL